MSLSRPLTSVLCGLAVFLMAGPLLGAPRQIDRAGHDGSLPPVNFVGIGEGPIWGPEDEEEEELPGTTAAILDELVGDPVFRASRRLSHGVLAYNRWVGELPEEALSVRHTDLLLVRGLLAEHLVARGVSVPAFPFASGEIAEASGLGGSEYTREDYLLPEPFQEGDYGSWNWILPGLSASAPSGFGLEWGEIFAAASYQHRVRYGPKDTGRRFNDGAVAIGFGAGDGERLGLQVAINSYSTLRSGFGDRMGVNLHLHRRWGQRYSFAAGWESVGAARITRQDTGQSRYVAISRWLTPLGGDMHKPFGLGMVTLGVGDGRFQTEDRWVAGKDGVGVFGSVAFRVLPPASLVVEWTGQDLLLAVSATPINSQRLVITSGFTDITGAAGDGARFIVGASWVLGFRQQDR